MHTAATVYSLITSKTRRVRRTANVFLKFFYVDFGIGASYFWNARINSFAFPPLKNLSSIGKSVLGDGGM